jgi:hypothetical protein
MIVVASLCEARHKCRTEWCWRVNMNRVADAVSRFEHVRWERVANIGYGLVVANTSVYLQSSAVTP